MSAINPILRIFMKPDKKEAPIVPKDVKEEENHLCNEKDVSKQKNDHNSEESLKEKAYNVNQINKGGKKSSQKKKKKVLQDDIPDFQQNEMTNLAPPKPLDFKYLTTKNNVKLLDKFKANSDWEQKLIHWFSRLRPGFNHFTTDDDVSLMRVIELIHKGEMPKSNDACNVKDVEKILFHFESKTEFYEKSDLAWIFSSLLFIDRLLNAEIAECLSNLLTKITVQINGLKTKEDPLYPYLMTVATILQRFFHL